MRPRRKIGKEPYAIDVFLDDGTPKELKTFHCTGCGFVLFQYYTRVKLIVAATALSPRNQEIGIIEGKEVKPPIIIQCHSNTCRLRYNIR